MHHPPLVVENKFRGLNKIPLFLPPGADQVALFTADAVRNREWQPSRYLRRFSVPSEVAAVMVVPSWVNASKRSA